MRVTIHQPEHLPWLGFFDKAARSDLLVLLDTVQFRKDYFQNRNRIRTATGWAWITVPVRKPVERPIAAAEIDTASRLRKRYVNRVREHYQHAPFFEHYFPALETIVLGSGHSLAAMNVSLLHLVCEPLGITTPTLRASTLILPPSHGPTELNLAICQAVGAQTYLSGISGREYLGVQRFTDAGINVEFQEFHHPIYRQRYEPFVPCMSVVDLLFNHGPASAAIVRGLGVDVLEHVFI